MSIKQHKTKISITISEQINNLLEKETQLEGISKSQLIEIALGIWIKERIKKDAAELATMTFDDLPTEDEWLALQNEISL